MPFAVGLGAFSQKETFEKFHERDGVRERTSRSRKVLMFDNVQSCDMLLRAVNVSDPGLRFNLTEERNPVEQSRDK